MSTQLTGTGNLRNQAYSGVLLWLNKIVQCDFFLCNCVRVSLWLTCIDEFLSCSRKCIFSSVLLYFLLQGFHLTNINRCNIDITGRVNEAETTLNVTEQQKIPEDKRKDSQLLGEMSYMLESYVVGMCFCSKADVEGMYQTRCAVCMSGFLSQMSNQQN